MTRYENMTDDELLRQSQGVNNPLLHAVAERLEMRLRDIADLEHMLGKKLDKNLEQPDQTNFDF